jgi:hypothetical protein
VPTLSRNSVYLLSAVLAVAVAVLGYLLYQERQQPDGVDISVGDQHISIQKK